MHIKQVPSSLRGRWVVVSILLLIPAVVATAPRVLPPDEGLSVLTVPEVDRNSVAPFGPHRVVFRSPLIQSALLGSFDSEDVPIVATTTAVQSENSVFVSPSNPFLLINSNNSADWPVTERYGADFWISSDGGQSWSGSIFGVGGTNRGDPATAINRLGHMYVGFIKGTRQAVAVSYTQGTSWNVHEIGPAYPPCPSISVDSVYCENLDKNHLWVDNSPTSPWDRRVYSGWTYFKFLRKPAFNDKLVSSKVQIISNVPSGGSPIVDLAAYEEGAWGQGVNIQTGPQGEVYVAWVYYGGLYQDESEIYFARSLDGGDTWVTHLIRGDIKGHRFYGLGGGKTMRTNSFPSMTVNQQTGRVYLVWTNVGAPGTNTGDPDIYMISSDDRGDSWGSATRVNQDMTGNGKDQWLPWITCDPVTGALSCIFYDSRSFENNDMAETYVAVSLTDGTSWEDFRVSDAAWSGDAIVGYTSYYAGDYIGITSRDNFVYPVWSDDRDGNMLAYISPFSLGGSYLADSDVPGTGTVSGDYTDTHASDNVREVITEISTNGNPPTRKSLLEHTWTFLVSPTPPLSFHVEAYRPANSEGDDFQFEYSRDNAEFEPLVLVNSATEQTYTASLPDDLDGTVYVRVTDTDRTPGNSSLDAIYIDQMYIEHLGPYVPPDPGPPPSDTLHVEDIDVVRYPAQGNKYYAEATVTVLDQHGQPAVGATVTGKFDGVTNEVGLTADTDESGEALFTSMLVNKPSGYWCFKVGNVELEGTAYDPASDLEDGDCEAGSSFLVEFPRASGGFGLTSDAGMSGLESSRVRFRLPQATPVKLEVFDINGRKVTTLVDGTLSAGPHAVDWSDERAASGVYFYRLEADGRVETAKVVRLNR